MNAGTAIGLAIIFVGVTLMMIGVRGRAANVAQSGATGSLTPPIYASTTPNSPPITPLVNPGTVSA